MSLVVKHKAVVGVTCISELVAGRETHEAALGSTHELVAESETHEAAVDSTHELVFAGGETHKAGVGE